MTASTVPGETEAAEIPLMGYPSGWPVPAGGHVFDGNVLREFTRRGSEARR